MIEKNTKFKTNGNSMIDKILYITEHTAILSDAFKRKVDNIALGILTNHKHANIKESIEELKEDMSRLSIFKREFIDELVFCLECGLRYEIKAKEANDLRKN